jgi:hypothetical protein
MRAVPEPLDHQTPRPAVNLASAGCSLDRPERSAPALGSAHGAHAALASIEYGERAKARRRYG